MQTLRVAVLMVLVSCTDGRVDALTADVVPELQRRIAVLEAHAATPPAAWWCTATACTRARVDGAELRTWAWCKPDGTGCAPTVDGCGPTCLGVR